MFISFDPNFRGDLWKGEEGSFIKKCSPFIERAQLCKFSQEEAQLLSGKTDLEAACDHFHDLGSGIVTVTLGQQGTLLSIWGKKRVVPSIPVKAVDTTGAGDAFIGCLLHQIAQLGRLGALYDDTERLGAMVSRANRAGAITTTAYGAIAALPTRERLEP